MKLLEETTKGFRAFYTSQLNQKADLKRERQHKAEQKRLYESQIDLEK